MPVSIDPLDSPSVTEMLFRNLEDEILSGAIVKGEKLPSEKAIADQAGVGRRAVREALKALEMKGLIEIRKGSGAFVVRNDLESYTATMVRNVQSYLGDERASLEDILLFRTLISGGIIVMLASDAALRERALPAIHEAMSTQDRAVSSGDTSLYNDAHFRYHRAIVNSVENPIISMLYDQVMKIIEPYMRISASRAEVMSTSLSEHRAIVNAIVEGNPAKARAAFEQHLKLSEEHLHPLIPPDA